VSTYPQHIALAQNTATGEAEWTVYTGRDALQQAEYRAAKWAERPGWVAFVRLTDQPSLMIINPVRVCTDRVT
jgi:hypothetical protein